MNQKTNRQPRRRVQAVQYKKDLGQHFLYDSELLRLLVKQTGLAENDNVLEIGAGVGTLTRILCESAYHVTAVEVDAALIPWLKNLAGEYENLTVINRDIRNVDIGSLSLGDGFIVVANIPYNITSQIFDLFWGKEHPIRQMSVMVQKEVAEKLTATPGNKAYGLMSVRCDYYCISEVIAQVPAAAFTPPPNVDSAFVKLTFRKEPSHEVQDEKLLWRMIEASYRMRRKTLLNALKTVAQLPAETFQDILRSMGLAATVRGEELSVKQWIDLSNQLASKIHPYLALEHC